jgi:uncharacterized protein YndB with AHSA1/START domain
MRPVVASREINASRERVFDYLSDIANHSVFCDHFLRDFRLERLQSIGRGASASFCLGFPLGRQCGDIVFTELERPQTIVAEGGLGRIGRIDVRVAWTLTVAAQGVTRVELSFVTEPTTAAERLREALGMRWWLRRQVRLALRRLGAVLEGAERSPEPVRAAAG